MAPRVTADPAGRRRTIAAGAVGLVVLGALIVAAVLVGHHGGGTPAHAAAAPVEVPLVVGESADDAASRLHRLGLSTRTTAVPAPGIRPGTVTSQKPVAGRTTRARSTVRLAVSETPRWRTVTRFSGTESVYFRIRGERWRIVSSVQNARHCHLLVFCSGSSAQVLGSGGGSAIQSFGLDDGDGRARTFTTGPGVYRVRVDPASGDTRWSISVQDDY